MTTLTSNFNDYDLEYIKNQKYLKNLENFHIFENLLTRIGYAVLDNQYLQQIDQTRRYQRKRKSKEQTNGKIIKKVKN